MHTNLRTGKTDIFLHIKGWELFDRLRRHASGDLYLNVLNQYTVRRSCLLLAKTSSACPSVHPVARVFYPRLFSKSCKKYFMPAIVE
jgi:hypothetical protein